MGTHVAVLHGVSFPLLTVAQCVHDRRLVQVPCGDKAMDPYKNPPKWGVTLRANLHFGHTSARLPVAVFPNAEVV